MREAAIEARRTVTVTNAKGVHARPSAQIVRAVQPLDAKVTIANGAVTAAADSILDVMMLAACEGCAIEITAEGPDAEKAVAIVADLVTERFGEPA